MSKNVAIIHLILLQIYEYKMAITSFLPKKLEIAKSIPLRISHL